MTQTRGITDVSAAFLGAQGEATRIVVARESRVGDVRIHDLDGHKLSNVTLATAGPEERIVGDSLYRRLAVSPSGKAIAGWAASTDKLTAIVWDSHDGHALFRKEGANGNALVRHSHPTAG